MTAKEMFEQAGLENRTELYKKDKIKEIQYSTNDGTWIVMSEEEIEYVQNHSKHSLPTNLLPAIIKTYEELGWK